MPEKEGLEGEFLEFPRREISRGVGISGTDPIVPRHAQQDEGLSAPTCSMTRGGFLTGYLKGGLFMRMHLTPRAVSIILVFGCALMPRAYAQSGRGTISGLVTDVSGAVIPNADVRATNAATGVTLSTKTNGTGLYAFPALSPGTYVLAFTKQGFQTLMHKNVVVGVDQTIKVSSALKPGGVNQSVTVTATPSVTSITNSTVGQRITAATIDRVPLVTRDVYELVQLSPAVTPPDGVIHSTDLRVGISAYTIDGQPKGTLSYQIDGSPVSVGENNFGTTIPAIEPPEDAVQEFSVETQPDSAAYQGGGAGVISLVTKSGTNAFHGDMFIFDRPNRFAANNSFVKASEIENGQPNKPPDYHRYQWGASLGGPIRRDKIFFFADYEGTQDRSLGTLTTTMPTAAERTGDFSADGFTIYNPFAPDLPTGNRQAFTNNTIPSNLLDPVSAAVAKFYPMPNQQGTGPYHANNYFTSFLNPTNLEKFDVRLDGNLGERNHLWGRYSFQNAYTASGGGWANNAFNTGYVTNQTKNQDVLLSDDLTLSPSTLLTLRYSFVRHFEYQTNPLGAGFDLTSIGMPSSMAQQELWKLVPFFRLTWTTSPIGNYAYEPFRFASMNHDAIAALSTIQGRHNLKFGFEFEKKLMNDGQAIAPSGYFIFDNTATSSTTFAGDGSDFASFMLGMGSPIEWQGAAFTKDIFAALSNPYYGSYIQDQYHISNHLTLNLGLRWDVFGGRNERHGRLESFNPQLQYAVNGVPMVGGEQFVHGHQSPFQNSVWNLGPRFGMAYQPFHNLVVRGGFGIFYGPSLSSVANAVFDADSFQAGTPWIATRYNADGNSIMNNPLSDPFPGGIVQPTNGSLGPATNLGMALSTVLPSTPMPTTYNFNFGIQYQLPSEYVFSAAWVGSRGLHLSGSGDLNQVPLQTIAQYKSALSDQISNPYLDAVSNPSAPFYNLPTIPRWQAIQSFPQFSTGSPFGGVAVNNLPLYDSVYHSLQLKIEKRLTHHFTTVGSYTFSKLISDGGAPIGWIGQHSGAQDYLNLNLERSLSPQDISQWLNWMVSYDLPIGPGRWINTGGRWTNFWLGGWRLNSVLSLSTGVPIIVSGATNDPWFSQRPDLVCDAAKGAPHTAQQWFLPNCYAMPKSIYLPGTGPATLPDVRANGTRNLDLSMFKDFAFSESKSLQFQVAAFNVTNSVQLGLPNASWNPQDLSTFGQITYQGNSPRQLQFALRLMF
jgi:hypothetical protein